ncbi:ATP-grasp domain-containing protein [Streptomyces sp. Amel2xB2]|uniref:ATP-grasp domain-containing protein n=1 Tax=Streptomyces sp. Amel2xB2 TaxID=1305829 RepID=UPI000DBA61D8|nr:ATP-grasp domain-containing protein [Streptomyces sp. Amel2xB2]RAJ68801.1 ATP-grasp domain-containing protein [Streptomyces sp. Amel2xB2]
MQLYLLALNPTESVTHGFLPAARDRELDVTLLTDRPQEHTGEAVSGAGDGRLEVLGCDVRDAAAVIARIAAHRPPDAVFTNSDHLQTQAALAAEYFGLPGKDWRAALRAKDKAEMRRHLAAAGADTVWAGEIAAEDELPSGLAALGEVPFPCVVKPREGVASEDVVLAADDAGLARLCAEIRQRRPGAALLVEEYLPGELHTLETLGDGSRLHELGGFRTLVSPPPYFIEHRMTYVRRHPEPVREAVLAQLGALGVGLGACHTEFVVQDGRARIIEVNYRAVGDQGDLLLADLLDIPLFAYVLDAHLGTPLPSPLPVRTGGAARVDYPCADRGGTLTAAPGASDVYEGEVRRVYRPLRAVGERHDLHHTNRDYLGALRTTGPDQQSVDRVADGFLAAQRWEILP